GLPEALRFWKTLIDETEAERTFRVGLIYGPSGCGKSSFVKAGLLPRLEGHVHAIYLEAASDDTEPRLARLVRRSFPELPHGPLVELLAAFRRGAGPPGSKLLLVLDQFEQWLHARLDDPAAELVRALRQCDGGRLQCLALVRDDFWMAATRFMRELDQRLVERQNSAAVDLFDPFHARRVLFDFGRAYGRVGQAFQPDAVPHADAGALASQAGRPKAPPTAEQDGFLTQAVIGLTRDGKVSPVRLALFAEMVKGKPWIPATLRALGGIEGVGVAFLEEAFSASTAPPAHRLHQQAARAVLAALLPESGSDIKGHKRSRDELLSASGYANRPAEFDELMRILDGDLRLVTPADEDAEVRNAERGTRSDAEQSSGAEAASRAPHSALPAPRSYQLTHDYLVPSLREWLTRQRRRTRRGRAELRLAERSAEWNARPGRRHLPNWWEWLGIRAWTRRHDWSEPQRRCMRAAGRFHVTRSLVLLIVAGLASWGAWEVNGQVEARALRERLLLARTADVPALVPAIDRRRRFIGPLLRAALDDPNLDPKQRMHASLALLPADPRQAAYLAERLLESTPHELPVLRDAIGPDRPEVTQTLWTVASNPHETADRRLRAACALADFTPDDARWDQVAGDVVGALLARGPRDFDAWLDLLRCVRGQLAEPFRSVYLGTGGGQPADRSLALSALLDDPDQIGGQIVDLVRGADAEQLALLVPTLKRNREQAISRLRSALGEPLAPPHAAVGSAAAASVLPAEIRARIERADGMLTDAFAFCQTLPLAELDNLLAQLNESPYQVTRVRPYRADGKRLAAVCWLNDGVQRRAAVGMSADELSDQDRSRREEGWICDDVAGYLYEEGGANAAGVRYACVWRRRVADHDDARLVLGVADPKKDDERLKKDGFAYRGLSQWRGNDGGARYAVLWCKPSPTWNASWDLRDSVYRAKASLGWRQTDLSVRATAALGERPRTPEERLARAERAVERDPTDNKAKLDLAQAKLELGQFEEANSAVQSVVIDAYRASVGGGKFDEDAAMRAFLLYFSGNAGDLQTGAPREMLNLIQSKFNSLMAFADAYGGAEQPLSRLEIAVRSRPFDADLLCQAAAACSMASMTVRHTQGERAAGLNDRAMELLTQAIAAGFDDFARLAQNPDFDPLRGDDRFARILAEGAGPAVYAGVWWFDPEWISTELHGLSPQEHLRRCRELADSGYRPVVVALGEPSSGQPALAASAWERPAISNQLKEQFAKCRANVATALVALGRTEDVEPLLRHGDDPRLRTYLLERLATIEPRPALLADAVSAGEMDAAQRAGLLLALGQSRSATSKSAPGGDALKAALLKRYRTDPDPGVHGAAEWLLRRLACEDEINQAEEQFAGSGWTAGRRWYVNAQRQTLAIITGPVQFLMGAPGSEVNRGEDEPQHLRRIERTFAIGVKEVTMEQFRRFRADAGDSVAPEPNCPAMRLSWHDAAAYCNWLSGQEGIPQVDWCYEPVAIGANTLQAKSDALLRTGYRLPTEAEWECACRAGTQTSRHFGEADTLLDGYDWFKENTQSLRTMPVARLKPNELGLFDLYGNAVEWCHSKYDPYVVPRDGTPVLDFDDWDPVSANRVMRGGALGDNPSEMRSARRRSVAADSKTGPHGLRVARTITPPRPRRRP
ncbi:MAG TPA: SUMF1/EgtB/PvdO family nonheme iron enzyme, partial [Pirellulales bacterium]|nr:SUMF1/EgtB/PvdO family nonheme iron enzyme [Pirellulales bacterium]